MDYFRTTLFLSKIISECMPILIWLWKIFNKKPNKKTVKIVILGGQYSGKTELWCRLQGIINKEKGGTSKEEIKKFVLGKKKDGTSVIVEDSIDMGGGDGYVNEYDKLIVSDGIFIYYLIDVRKIKQDKGDTKLRLRKIASLAKKNNLHNCGITILGTHIDSDDEYGKYPGTKEDAKKEIACEILGNPIKGLLSTRVEIISTTNPTDIETIKNEIIKTLE